MEVGDGAAGVGVVPAALEEDGNVGVLVPVFVDGVAALGPVGATAAVGEDVPGPLLVEGQEAKGGAAGAKAQGRAEDFGDALELGSEDAFEVGVGCGFLAGEGHAVGVADEALFEGAALAHGRNQVVAGSLADDLGTQVGRIEGGEGALVGPGVGGAHGADAAVAPGLDGDPLDGVVAVGGFLREGVPLAAGAAAAADIVHHHGVSATRVPVRLAGVAAGVLEVWRSLDKGGELSIDRLAVEGGQVEVGGQLHAVARRDKDVGQHDGVVGAVGTLISDFRHSSIKRVRDQAVTSRCAMGRLQGQ